MNKRLRLCYIKNEIEQTVAQLLQTKAKGNRLATVVQQTRHKGLRSRRLGRITMKERKTWQKRIVSLLMALAMVVTQIGVWN